MPMRSSCWQALRLVTIALGSFTIATLFSFPLSRHVVHSRELLLAVAVVITSVRAGLAAGLLVAVVSALIFDWFFDITPHVLDFNVGGIVRVTVFGLLAGLVAVLELQRRRAIEHLETINRELRTALSEIKTLRGLLPICSYCKQLKTEGDSSKYPFRRIRMLSGRKAKSTAFPLGSRFKPD